MNAQPLAELLCEPAQCGAYYLAASDLEPLQGAAAALEFCCAHVSLHDCRDKADILKRFATALAFPEEFGANWDALADCLGDLSWLPAEGYVLSLEHSQGFREERRDDYDTLVSVLEEAADAWRERGLPFWAFIAVPDADFAAMPS